MRKAKAKRQRARGEVEDAFRAKARLLFSTFAFCLLPFAFTSAFTTAFTQEGRTRPRKATAAPAQPPGKSARGGRQESPSSAVQKNAAARPQASPSPTPEPSSQAVDDEEVVKITTSEVLLPVTVREAGGALVTNLAREDFRVFEDGREQPLRDLALRQVPVDVALLVDASSSVAGNIEDFRRAAEEFAGRIAEEDRVSLVKFDDRVELLLDWTKSRHQLRRALSRITPGVYTRFNDALALVAREQFRKDQRRRALVVLSDGIDSNMGAATLEASLRALLESQVSVYVISNTEIERANKKSEIDNLLGGTEASVRFNQIRIDGLREALRVLDVSEGNLEQLTRATGGRLYKPQSFGDLTRVYTEIAEELRNQYALYYTPTNAARDGSFRRVSVEVPGRAVRVTTRVGYYAPQS